MRILRVAALLGAVMLVTVSGQAQGSTGMCWRVPLIERDLSARVKQIVSSGDVGTQQALHLPASNANDVAVLTDTAQCRSVAVANQLATKRDSLAPPRPVVVIRTGNTASPTLMRYVVWDNTGVGEWSSVTVYDANFTYLGGFVF